MKQLWAPWRMSYIAEERPAGCIFCEKIAENDDRKNFIVHRGEHCFIILNAFPYTSGHVMVVPYAHLDQLVKVPQEAADELMRLSQTMEGVLRTVYNAEGVNLGMNIGKCAGAGVAGHVHMHVLPRWTADANFVSVVGETRVLPETLETTYEKIKKAMR